MYFVSLFGKQKCIADRQFGGEVDRVAKLTRFLVEASNSLALFAVCFSSISWIIKFIWNRVLYFANWQIFKANANLLFAFLVRHFNLAQGQTDHEEG